MSDTDTSTVDLNVNANAEPAEILGAHDATPAAINAEEGWEVEDVGRVRGDTFQSVVDAEQATARAAEGDDPDALGVPAELPESEIGDDDDETARRPAAKAKTVDPQKGDGKGKLALSKRVEKLKGKIDEGTRARRELERGNIDLARRLLAEAEGRPAPRAAAADDRPRREDGTFKPVTERPAPRAVAAKEPVVPARPVRPSWEKFQAEDKTYDEYQQANEKYLDDLTAYQDGVIEHREWKLRQELGGQIETTSQRMEAMTQATARERANAAFMARRDVVQREYGEKWDTIKANWREYDNAGYRSDFLETVVQLHDQGARVMASLGEQIEKAAVLAEYDEWTRGMFDGIMSLEDPAPVLLALADDPEAFERISQLPHSRAIAALGALSGRLMAGERAHGSRPARVSAAPAPARPVGGRREGGKTERSDLEDMPFEDYVRHRNEQQGRR